MFRILTFILLSATIAFSQKSTSTIRGLVLDGDSHSPLPGASVTIKNSTLGTSTDENGAFRFDQVELGRYLVQASFVGYKTTVQPEILLEGGKEQVITFYLTPGDTTLNEVVVHYMKTENLNNTYEITNEQTLRYAATYLDPARVAASLPGVAVADDQANGIVVRGNGPNTTQWRLEGVEIVNPNHLSNAGTFSDRATQSGGGVNILSTQLLGTTNFLTGAYAASYGNAMGGIMDMRFRKGNNEQNEFTAQAGLIGLDLAAEGPFSKNGKASYLANYRYSFTGILSAMGVSLGGEKMTFQDFSFNVSLPTKKAGEFTLFGVGGTSKNVFSADKDVANWEVEKDAFNITYKNRMGAAGITHTLPLSRKTSIRSTLAASGLSTEREGIHLNPADPQQVLSTDLDEIQKVKLAFTTALNHRLNEKHRILAGAYLYHDTDKLKVNTQSGEMEVTSFMPYATWQWSPTSKFRTEIGVNYFYFGFNGKSSVEPRGALKWEVAPRNTISLSYGWHSQAQTPQTYLSLGSRVSNNNRNLGLNKARHYGVAYEYRFLKNSSLKVEGYYQEISNVPVSSSVPTYSVLNLVENSVTYALVNKGLGRNMGVEATWNTYLAKDFYLMVSGSVYDSRYKGVSGNWRSTRFNGNHTFAATGGKEIRTAKNNVWGINAKITWLGGFRDTPVDVTASAAAGTTVYRVSQSYTLQMKDYFRPDLRVYWKTNREKINTTLAIDIQNVSNTKNEAFSYYDTYQKKVVVRDQLGLIPVLSYRVEF
ncbi:carboxypeptidase regulatory-like domain-containing protein [Ravibacter arvi]|uniref:Carboxypeptidase regulatory-like domain-containing protein n=1 Tax=Ravibacter arvi TaxID=2051041 RepID=A0ABP8LVA0_9BACT